MNSEIHIASLIVQCAPENLASVKQAIQTLDPQGEIHGEDPVGKLVLVLEAPGNKEMMAKIDAINGFEQVINAALVFHQMSEANELDEQAELPEGFEVPEAYFESDANSMNKNQNIKLTGGNP